MLNGKVAENQRSQETCLIHFDCFREMEQNQIDEFIWKASKITSQFTSSH